MDGAGADESLPSSGGAAELRAELGAGGGPELTRREVVRGALVAACAPLLASGLEGCARRIPASRSLLVPPVDGVVSLTRAQAPELFRDGGSIVVRTSDDPQVQKTQKTVFLVVSLGTSFLALEGTCTHQKCDLSWVPEDREAECPCHGSRFASDGTVLHAPATSDLGTRPVSIGTAGEVRVRLYPSDGVFPDMVAGQVHLDLTQLSALQAVGGSLVGQPEGVHSPIMVIRKSEAELISYSAHCPHQGCTVRPTCAHTGCVGTGPDEHFLHCPCHGSDFHLADGSPVTLNQPAQSPLARLEVQFQGGTTATVLIPDFLR